MRVIIIGNNTEGNIDGIGKHARILSEEFNRQGHLAKLYSGVSGLNSFSSLFSFAMSWVYLKVIYEILIHHYDLVIVEYPFRDHNPFIAIPHILLSLIAKSRSTIFAVSMHEYDRVNKLRQMLIDVLRFFSDVVYVSEKKYVERFDHGRNKYYVRTIPNHIVCNKTNKKYKKSNFCYFGLISKAKAFEEMIEAWRVFNKTGDCHLHIISSSVIPETISIPDSIVYHHDLPMEEVVEIMFDCAYSIVPVVPEIGLNNSSFVSSCQCGCVPIGVFSKDLSSNNYIIHCDDYSIDNFSGALKRSQDINEEEYKIMSEKCIEYGRNFSLEKTVTQMISGYENFVNKHK